MPDFRLRKIRSIFITLRVLTVFISYALRYRFYDFLLYDGDAGYASPLYTNLSGDVTAVQLRDIS
jgi:hypothetical protein